MKNKFLTFLLAPTILMGCFWGDEAHEYKRLTRDFWLNWWGEPNDKHILLSTEKTGNGGTFVIKETVFAVGYDDNFIIAKQHPN